MDNRICEHTKMGSMKEHITARGIIGVEFEKETRHERNTREARGKMEQLDM